MPTAEAKQNPAMFRSKQTVSMVREVIHKDGTKQLIQADLPIGNGWNDGTAIYWINQGWRSEEEYLATKHLEAIKAERDALMDEPKRRR